MQYLLLQFLKTLTVVLDKNIVTRAVGLMLFASFYIMLISASE